MSGKEGRTGQRLDHINCYLNYFILVLHLLIIKFYNLGPDSNSSIFGLPPYTALQVCSVDIYKTKYARLHCLATICVFMALTMHHSCSDHLSHRLIA